MVEDRQRGIAAFARFMRQMNEPQYDGMTSWELLPLGLEVRSVEQLLRHAYRLLTTARPIDDYYEIFLSVTSASLERTLRVANGYAQLKRRKGWPNDLHSNGHRIVKLNNRLLRNLNRSADGDVDVLSRVQAMKDDHVVNALLGLADQYASGGRFRYLDELAKRKTMMPGEGALGAWVTLLDEVSDKHPDLDVPTGSEEDLDALHMLLAESFRGWVEFVSDMAASGLLGRRAQEFGSRIRPAVLFGGRQPAP
jgi:hypothetical protein